ncbi:hypothetical protein MRX96_052323 [Rhipicephalus microplus]
MIDTDARRRRFWVGKMDSCQAWPLRSEIFGATPCSESRRLTACRAGNGRVGSRDEGIVRRRSSTRLPSTIRKSLRGRETGPWKGRYRPIGRPFPKGKIKCTRRALRRSSSAPSVTKASNLLRVVSSAQLILQKSLASPM